MPASVIIYHLKHFDTIFPVVHQSVSVGEDPALGRDPDHTAGLSLALVETKLDYMGSSVLMTRLSQLQLEVKDEWHVDADQSCNTPLATNR